MEPRSALYHVLLVAFAYAQPVPTPGRIPKVYNALITSNQNLEASKAYPVYQPVLHDAFSYPYHPFFYQPGLPSLYPLPPSLPPAQPPVAPPGSTPENEPSHPPSESPDSSTPQPDTSKTDEDNEKSTPNSIQPPSTESPIPLNEFGLPPQVLPLGRFDRPYTGFNQVAPFSYNYPAIRYYDPYDPFNINPYFNLIRPFPNAFTPVAPPEPAPAPKEAEKPKESDSMTPPAEPSSDLNILNYSGKNPSIPDVPPPPLPRGGLQSDKNE